MMVSCKTVSEIATLCRMSGIKYNTYKLLNNNSELLVVFKENKLVKIGFSSTLMDVASCAVINDEITEVYKSVTIGKFNGVIIYTENNFIIAFKNGYEYTSRYYAIDISKDDVLKIINRHSNIIRSSILNYIINITKAYNKKDNICSINTLNDKYIQYIDVNNVIIFNREIYYNDTFISKGNKLKILSLFKDKKLYIKTLNKSFMIIFSTEDRKENFIKNIQMNILSTICMHDDIIIIGGLIIILHTNKIYKFLHLCSYAQVSVIESKKKYKIYNNNRCKIIIDKVSYNIEKKGKSHLEQMDFINIKQIKDFDEYNNS